MSDRRGSTKARCALRACPFRRTRDKERDPRKRATGRKRSSLRRTSASRRRDPREKEKTLQDEISRLETLARKERRSAPSSMKTVARSREQDDGYSVFHRGRGDEETPQPTRNLGSASSGRTAVESAARAFIRRSRAGIRGHEAPHGKLPMFSTHGRGQDGTACPEPSPFRKRRRHDPYRHMSEYMRRYGLPASSARLGIRWL